MKIHCGLWHLFCLFVLALALGAISAASTWAAAVGMPEGIIVPVSDIDGNYSVSWPASTTPEAIYVLQEATNSTFTTRLQTYPGTTALSVAISDRPIGYTYYYRIKATLNGYSDSDWISNDVGCEVSPLSHTAWFAGGNKRPTSLRDANVLVFLDKLHYIFIKSTDGSSDPNCTINGIEQGSYHWSPTDNWLTAKATYITPLFDCGFDAAIGTFTVNGDSASLDDGISPPTPVNKIIRTSNPLVGAWGWVAPTDQDSAVIVFLDDANYIFMQKGDTPLPPDPDACGQTGMEHGTYTWNQSTKIFTAIAPIDSTGCWGFGTPNPTGGPGSGTPSGSTAEIFENTLVFTSPGEAPSTFSRISDPLTFDVTADTIMAPASITVPAGETDGNYEVNWEASTTKDVTYIVEEATDIDFTTNRRQVYSGPNSKVDISGRYYNTSYYYRVKATKTGLAESTWCVSAKSGLVTAPTYTTLSIELSSQTILLGKTIDIVGKITTPGAEGTKSLDLSGLTITLTSTDPNLMPTTVQVVTDAITGTFKFPGVAGFTSKSLYTLQASFAGVPGRHLAKSESSAMSVLVGDMAGYAVLVEGKLSPAEDGLASHNKTTNRIYASLKERGFEDANIMYFNYNKTQTYIGKDGVPAPIEVDAVPSKAKIQEAIETWAKGKMTGLPAPLYIIMVDHGSIDKFHIGSETITPADLDQWLTTLEDSLKGNVNALVEKRVIILGACYSGSFIPTLSKVGRVIISSASENEESYKGPKEPPPDEIRSGEFFIDELFTNLRSGYNVKNSFTYATDKTTFFTRRGGITADSNTIMQHPLLDDNGDGKGSNILGLDGTTTENIYLGAGLTRDANVVDSPAEIKEVTSTLFLDSGSSSALLWALPYKLSDLLASAWMEIRAPSTVLTAKSGSNQLELDIPKVPMPKTASRWEKQLATFSEPGKYEIFYYVRDTLTNQDSPMKRSVVYKNQAGNQAPTPFHLRAPANSSEQKTMVIFDWGEALDPDADPVSYTLTIASNPDFTAAHIVYRQEEIESSPTFVDGAAGLKDLTTYYWKIEAIDQYGAKTPSSEIWSFYTDNTNSAGGGIITGLVYSNLDSSAISGALVNIVGIGSYTTGSSGRYIIQTKDKTSGLTVSVLANGKKSEVSNVAAELGKTTKVNFAASTTIPGMPIIGTATAGNAQAAVAFTAPLSNGGSAITSYTVTSAPGGKTATGTASPITVPGLTNGKDYTFTVTATNAVGVGPASAKSASVKLNACLDPPSIKVPAFDKDGNSYTISWAASKTTGGTIKYVVEESTTYAFSLSTTNQIYNDTGLSVTVSTARPTNKTYYYRVKAQKAGVPDSGWRTGANGCAVPGGAAVAAPSALTFTAIVAKGYTVNWVAPTSPGVTYVLEEAINSAFSSELRTAYSGTAKTIKIAGRKPGVTYYYRVRALKDGSKDSVWKVANKKAT